MQQMTKEQFFEAWKSATVDELRAAAESQGLTLQTSKKRDMIEEAWTFYLSQQRRAATGEPAPAPAPAPEPEAAPATTAPLVWEGRCIPVLAGRNRAGFRFGKKWQELSPTPTSEQLAELKRDKYLQVRIKR